jgi:MinD superfamily P-loop ATPase
MVAAVRGANFVLLVTEPTPLGLNDLQLAAGVVRELRLACGVVINRCTLGNSALKDYCLDSDLPILAEIPFDQRIAAAYARGDSVTAEVPELAGTLSGLLTRVLDLASVVSQ